MGVLENERFSTGNHVAVFVDGDGAEDIFGVGVVGSRLPDGTSFDMAANTGARPIHVVGTPEPQDIVDGPHTYEVTIAELRLRSAKDVDLINGGRVNIVEIDQYNGQRLRMARGCQLQGARITVPANMPVASNLTFIAMSMQ